MTTVLSARRLPLLVALGAVVFSFWPALLGGGSLLSADIVATAPPFESYQPADFSLENGPGDPINIHAHWASLAADIRSGDAGWWNPELAAGQPTFKGGLPVFNLTYLVVPDWFAPGLVAAVRALTAIGLTFGLLRTIGLTRVASVAGGLAFGFSGFMVGWMNWPHSSVAALAPGLLWAVEKVIRDPRPWRAVPLGLVAALMVWANFPSVLIYVLLGVGVYGLIRLFSEWRRSGEGPGWVWPRLGVAALAVVLAALLGGPHLLGFGEYIDWADTSHRVGNPDDSSAGLTYLLTAVAPALWGSDAVGVPWFGEGNWVEFNAHMGAAAVLLATFGLVSSVRSSDRRLRSVAWGLVAVSGLGVLIAYVGGPVAVALGDLTGSQGGLMTRAKVLWSLGVALGSALGVERLVGRSDDAGRSLRRDLAATGVVLVGMLLVMAPSVRDWLDTARGIDVLRPTIQASLVPMLATGAVAVVAVARARNRLSGRLAGWILVMVLGVELLSFAMPVPTIVSRSERLTETPAHAAVRDLLEPGERLAGEGRTFFPSTTQLFDIPDARGQLQKSPGYQELLRAVDPDMLTTAGGGTPTYPNIASNTDVASPVWDAMAIGLWAQFPGSRLPGTIAVPVVASSTVVTTEGITGSTTVPAGGLRAVVVQFEPLEPGFLDIEVGTDDGISSERRWVDLPDFGLLTVPVLGERLTEGSPVTVTLRNVDGAVLAGIGDDGDLAVGTVAGDDEFELVRVGDVVLLDRPVQPVRLVTAAVVEPDPERAAALVARRTGPPDVAVVDRDVGLAEAPSPDAETAVRLVGSGTDRMEVEVRTEQPALLVFSTADYPGWRATVDGVVVDHVTADAAFIGVPVPPGAERVTIEFRPRRLGGGFASLAAGLLAMVAILAWSRHRGDLRSPRRPAR